MLALLFTTPATTAASASAAQPPATIVDHADFAGPSLVVRAATIHTGDGQSFNNAMLVVRSGRVDHVGNWDPARVPPGSRIVEFPAGVITPGIVAASSPVARGATTDESMAAAFRAVDGFDRYADLRGWLDSGVTTAHVSPGDDRLITGRGAVVRLAGPAQGRVLRDEADLSISLLDAVYNAPLLLRPLIPPSADRLIEPAVPQAPGSRIELFTALKDAIENAQRGGEGPVLGPLGLFHDRELARAWNDNIPLRIRVDRADDLRAAIAFLDDQRRAAAPQPGYIVGGREAALIAAQDRWPNTAPVVYLLDASFNRPASDRGYNPNPLRRQPANDVRTLIDRLGQSQLALAMGQGSLTDLRLAIARSIGVGNDAAITANEALHAITLAPARILGVDHLVGSLEPGKLADFVVFTAEPFELGAAVDRVYMSGRLVHRTDLIDADRPQHNQHAHPHAANTAPPTVIRAGSIWLGPGENLRNGEILVVNGKIAEVGPRVARPRGATVINAGENAFITPGFIDAHGHLGLAGDASPTPANLRLGDLAGVSDELDLRVAAAGITTVMLSPRRPVAQGSRISAVKTFGTSPADRVLAEPAAVFFDVRSEDHLTIPRTLKQRIDAGRAYAKRWSDHAEKVQEWEKARAEGKDIEPEEPKVEEAPTQPSDDDPLTGTWRATLSGGPIPPSEQPEGTLAITLRGNQWEARLIEPPLPPGLEVKISGTLDGTKLTGTIELDTGGMGTPEIQAEITGPDIIEGTISLQGLTVNISANRTDKSAPTFRVARGKRRTTGKDGRPLPPPIDENLEPLRAVIEGRAPLVVAADSPRQIDAVINVVVNEAKLPLILLDATRAQAHTEKLSEHNIGVIVPESIIRREGFDSRYVQSADLASSGVPVLFGSRREDGAASLPAHVLYAVANGLSPEQAIAALTTNAAKQFKLDNRVGSIAKGHDADLIIFSGYPFDPGTRVQRVLINGRPVQSFTTDTSSDSQDTQDAQQSTSSDEEGF